jgi:predicted DNA-binding transcriptional regulator AlpA
VPEKVLNNPPPPQIIEGRERLLTDVALSDWLQCTTAFIHREVKAGRLKAILLKEREFRFRWSDVDEWIKAREGLV